MYASFILKIADLLALYKVSLLSSKLRSVNLSAAFGKCLSGVNEISEKDIFPLIF